MDPKFIIFAGHKEASSAISVKYCRVLFSPPPSSRRCIIVMRDLVARNAINPRIHYFARITFSGISVNPNSTHSPGILIGDALSVDRLLCSLLFLVDDLGLFRICSGTRLKIEIEKATCRKVAKGSERSMFLGKVCRWTTWN